MWSLALHLALIAAPDARPEPVPTVACWELDGALASAVGGEPLAVEPASGGTFVPATLSDGATRVLQVAPGARVTVPIAFTLRGPGYQGRWTIVMDVMVGEPPPVPKPRRAKKPTWRVAPLVQTDPWNDDDAELLVDRTRGLDVAGEHGGTLEEGTWHRVAMVVDENDKTVTGFVDGVMVRRVKTEIADSRWALEPEILLFADEERAHPGMRLAALQVRTGAMDAGHIAALGGPRAEGLPRPEAPLLSWTDPPPAALRPGQQLTATFRVSPPAGEVELALSSEPREQPRAVARGGADEPAIVLGRVAADAGLVHATVPPGVAPGRRRLELRWVGDATRKVEAPLDVLAPAGDQGAALVGAELLRNGGFDEGLEPWALTGDAAVEPTVGSNGNAVVGRRGDYAVSQIVALPPELQGDGFLVEASARSKRKDRAGIYGDRGVVAVRFIARDGTTLGEVRSPSVDKSEWCELAARGAVPAGTERVEVRFDGLERQGRRNEVALDRVSLVVKPIDAGPVRLSKLPILMPGDAVDEHYLVFETDADNVVPIVVWGPVGGAEQRLTRLVSTTVDRRHQVHQAVLGPLERGAEYSYRVELAGVVSPTWRFTAPRADDQPLSIAWLADNQHGWRTFRQLVPVFTEADPDLVVMAGDIVQRGHELREWQTEWFSPLSIGELGQTRPIAVARGNHDGDGALAHVYAPLPGNGHWYAFTRAGVRFIVLDSEADAGRVPEQLDWLDAELGGEDARGAAFRIVTFHRAPFSNRWDSPKSKYDGERWVRDHLVPRFEKGKVDLVIAGHAHAYQRMDRQGVRYLVVGGAGGRLDRHLTGKWPMDKDFVGHHWALMRVESSGAGGADEKAARIAWTATDFDGNVIDSWAMSARKKAAR